MTAAAGELPEELFEAPLEEFIPIRDGVAKRLRQEGQREAADRVKKTRKPSVSVWALNTLARTHPDQLSAVLDAGEMLRRAQEELQADELRRGTALLREAISATADQAVALAGENGVKVSASHRERMADTLFAVATSAVEHGEQLRAGRLLEDLESIGFLGTIAEDPAGDAAESDAVARRRIGEAEVAAKETADAARRARRRADELEREAEEARLRASNLEEEAERAAEDAAHKEAEAARAAAELEEARSLLR